MRFSDTAKSGISLAFSLGIIGAVLAILWMYGIAPYRRIPERPVFSNETQSPTHPPSVIAKLEPAPILQPTIAAKPKEDQEKKEKAKYNGRVNSGIGLVLRSQPSSDAPPAGGVDYNAKVAVLKETPDKEWLYIRQENTKETGWVRSGNITRN